MTESMWADALPEDAATAISTPTETLSPARLSTIRIRISGKNPGAEWMKEEGVYQPDQRLVLSDQLCMGIWRSASASPYGE